MNQLMNDGGDCKTALATPGLLNSVFEGFYKNTPISNLGISCFKTPSEWLNNLEKKIQKFLLSRCYHVSSYELLPELVGYEPFIAKK